MFVNFYFQTLLRIWDCFLLEGPKVLFRFSLAILKLHEKDILQKTDTMGIMKHLKACAKLTYDVEGLVKVGYSFLWRLVVKGWGIGFIVAVLKCCSNAQFLCTWVHAGQRDLGPNCRSFLEYRCKMDLQHRLLFHIAYLHSSLWRPGNERS